ncbi:3-hydroxydecanoyl-[ACP] dehydratase [plant metagenome]|uniref:3-hydroxydecanoyl-[ACP] dehydratase n=1 Tax=plant metagenome TaxID=1297885 RepID=A0A484QY95_9ZZZZ
MIAWPVAELVPHAGHAILLDAVLRFDEDTLEASASVPADSIFNNPDGSTPSWLGLEIMAQAVAAWAGCHARAQGLPVTLGFLLGTRRYACDVPSFPPGIDMTVHIARSLQDDSGMGVFECSLRVRHTTLATARLNVFSPPDAAQFVAESRE